MELANVGRDLRAPRIAAEVGSAAGEEAISAKSLQVDERPTAYASLGYIAVLTGPGSGLHRTSRAM